MQPPFPTRLVILSLSALLAVTVGCARLQPTVSDTQSAASARQRVIDEMVDSTVKVTIERDARRVVSASGVVVASQAAGDATEAVSYVLTAAHVLTGGEGTKIVVGFCGSHAARGKPNG